MKKNFAALFALVMTLCVSSAYAFSGGSGTSSDPYIIASVSDLNSMRTGSDGVYYKLSNDIQMSGPNYWDWTPIGDSGTPFAGHFDGNSKTIYVDIRPYSGNDTRLLSSTTSRALFGYVSGTITSLNVEGQVRGYNAAGIVSHLTSGSLSICSFSGNVSAYSRIGDEVFEEYLTETLDTLGDDYIYDATTFETRHIGGLYAGGIVWEMSGGSVISCDFRGSVIAQANDNAFSAGGIVSVMYDGSITGCSVSGDSSVTGSSTAQDTGRVMSSGGIAGYTNTPLSSSITGCMFEGTVNSSYYAGGITGETHGTLLENNTIQPNSIITGEYSSGGIAGYLSSGGRAYDNTVSLGSMVWSDGYSAGGVIGFLDTEQSSGVTVSGNKADSAVRGSSSRLGGIVGAVGSSTFTESAIGTGNTYSGASHGIGSDRYNLPSDYNTVQTEPAKYIIIPEDLDDATLNTAYPAKTLQTNAMPGMAVSWSISDSHLPDGMTLVDGILSGTPTETGDDFWFTVAATILSLDYTTDEQTFSLKVNSDFAITLPASMDSTGEIIFSAGDMINITFTAPAGTNLTTDILDVLPGLTVQSDSSASLTITGVIAEAGSWSFSVDGELSGTYSSTGTLTLTSRPPVSIITEILEPSSGQIYSAYSADINIYPSELSGISIMWTVSPDNEWYSVMGVQDGSKYFGRLSGTPTTAGNYTFSVILQAVKTSGTSTLLFTSSKDYSVYVSPAMGILTSSLPYAVVNEPYSADITAYMPASWSIIDGTLPHGLEWTASGDKMIISGTPTRTESQTFTVQALGTGGAASKDFTLSVTGAGSVDGFMLVISAEILPDAKEGTPYAHAFTANSSDVSWSVSDGALPEGLSLDIMGRLSGTPASSGVYAFTLTATFGGLTAVRNFSLTVSPALVITTSADLPSAKTGQNYSCTLETDAGSDKIAFWSIADGSSLPDGLTINRTTGTISGTPTSEGTYAFTVDAVVGNMTAQKEFTLTVSPAINIITAILPRAVVNVPYSAALSTDAASSDSVSWSISSGTLPDGLTLNALTGTISGITSDIGTYSFTVTARTSRLTASRTYTLTVGGMMAITTSSQLPEASAGSAYSLTLQADYVSGDAITWSVVSGTLPSGLSLSSGTGTISGTPVRAGTYTFTVRSDAGYSSAQKEFTLTVKFVITSGTYIPSAVTGEKYSYVFMSEGADNVRWELSGDTLPAGISLDYDGLLSGMTNEDGTYIFTVYALVSDDISAMKSVNFTVETYSAIPIVTADLPGGMVGEEYYAEFSARVDGVTWSIDEGTLPQGLELASNGVISGTPEESGRFLFTVKAEVSGRQSRKQYTLIVDEDEAPVSGNVSSSGGGCNSGIFTGAFAVMLPMLRRRKAGEEYYA